MVLMYASFFFSIYRAMRYGHIDSRTVIDAIMSIKKISYFLSSASELLLSPFRTCPL